MEAKSTIRKMLAGCTIAVPDYQRAYSWDKKQTDQFVTDLDDYISKELSSRYYFGHFLFEQDSDQEKYFIIDGQQRLTTIEIFLCAAFSILEKNLGMLDENLIEIREDMIKRNSTYRFSTVRYDNQFFRDYVVNQIESRNSANPSVSERRIRGAYDRFKNLLESCSTERIKKYILCISNALCTTHIVTDKAEAIQIFVFQNNRGKLPTKIEITKAEFMYAVHISSLSEEEKNNLLEELESRFYAIYMTISHIEKWLDEDDILLYALRVYFNDLGIDESSEKIASELKKNTAINFVKNFTAELEQSFISMKTLYNEYQNQKSYEIYSFAMLGRSLLMPFVIKAYEFDISDIDKNKLLNALQCILIRHRLIGTKAHLEDRVKDVFSKFTKETKGIEPIIKRIDYLKTTQDYWWNYWSNEKLKESISGGMNHDLAKLLLWKYENNLILEGDKHGYGFFSYDKIDKPELEHIAPQTPTNGEPIAAGYCAYDEDFKNNFLNCLGNYLLISKSHNSSIGNVPFKDKFESYTYLAQQREVQDMAKEKMIWGKDKIAKRKTKIIQFIMTHI